jgi:hypothetical protein
MEGFSGNGVDGASPSKGRVGRYRRGWQNHGRQNYFLEGLWRNFEKIPRAGGGEASAVVESRSGFRYEGGVEVLLCWRNLARS